MNLVRFHVLKNTISQHLKRGGKKPKPEETQARCTYQTASSRVQPHNILKAILTGSEKSKNQTHIGYGVLDGKRSLWSISSRYYSYYHIYLFLSVKLGKKNEFS